MTAVLDAERIKLSTTRSLLWTAAVVAVLSIGLAALQGVTAYGAAALPPERAVTGVAVFGVPVLMVLAAMTVTAEYRSGMIRTTFMATPDRTLILVAKAIVALTFSAVYAALMTIVAVVVAHLMAPPLVGSQLSFIDPATWRLIGAISLYAALTAVLGVGVGALLRHSAGAVAVLLLWPLLIEPVLGNLPNLGSEVGPYLPFANIFLFVRVQWLYPAYSEPWGEVGSLVYFVAVVTAVYLAAIAVVNRRDA
ncbi:ABC transporter permease [Mycobacterium sp. NPDC048908]|uniref:ABC transporter permease n=1 Tax=Mycobacterium sp. NPDC048908 TaxID=3364292 RepID=UPI003711B638